VFGHEHGHTPRFPGNRTLACEVDQLAAKALLERALTQKFIEQIVCDLLVMNFGCEPRRNQWFSPARTKNKRRTRSLISPITPKAFANFSPLTPKAFANFRLITPKAFANFSPGLERSDNPGLGDKKEF
jgi:hypothetical protein